MGICDRVRGAMGGGVVKVRILKEFGQKYASRQEDAQDKSRYMPARLERHLYLVFHTYKAALFQEHVLFEVIFLKVELLLSLW